jgi:hypothetical protein
MRFLLYSALLALISCGGGEVKRNIEETSYRTSGVEQFFLPELPAWANSSPSGRCFKSSSFHYMDFAKLSQNYQLTYPEMVELQAQYNDRLESYFRSTAVRFLKPVEEASFFANTMEQVRGGVRQFKLPNVNEVDVIWLDGYIADNKVADLKAMAKSGKFDERLPILFSACLSKQALSNWLSEQNLEQVGFYLLSAEWLNPYTSQLALKPRLRVEIKKLVNREIKINVIHPQSSDLFPTEIITE